MPFYLILPGFFALQLFHLLHQHLSLSLLLLSLLEPLNLSGLYLVDDDFFTPEGLLLLVLFNFLDFLDLFEPFNFHQLVLFYLLHLVVFPVSFLLVKLFFSDGGGFGISHHFIHELDVIELFIGGFNCPVLNGASHLVLFLVEVTLRHVLFLLLLELEHLFFLGLGKSQFLLLLLFSHLFFELLLLLGGLTDGFLRVKWGTFMRVRSSWWIIPSSR